MLESYKPILSSPEQTTTQAQTTAPGSSFTGGTNLFWKPEEDEPVNKNGTLGILGRTAALLPQSIGKGLTNQLDKISDTPTNVRNWMAQKDEEVLNDWASKEAAKKSWYDYRQKADTHLLGQSVKDWEQRVDEKQQAILNDNPNSKLAQAGVYANELGESVGAMIPTIAASAVTGGLMAAANGGSAAIGARAALGSKKALDAIETIKGVSEAAGLGTMFMGVYSNSLEDAVNNGADYQAAAKKALLDGLLEVGTEKMFAGIAGLGEGVFASTARKVVNSTGADDAVKMLGVKKAGVTLANMINRVSEMSKSSPVANLLIDALGEGAEEMVAEFFSPYIERATTNKYAENATLEEILRAGLGGALISFAMNPVGKISGKLTSPSDERMAQARMDFRTTDADQIIANMAALSFQDVTSADDITAIEKIIGRKLDRKPVMYAGEEVGYYADGLTNRARRRQAVEAIQEAIDANKTPQAIQTLRQKMSSIWDAEVEERQDIAGALAFADKVSEERLKTDKKYQGIYKSLKNYEAKFREAESKLGELSAAAEAEGATEEAKKSAETAQNEYNRIKDKLSKARDAERAERKRIRHDIDYNLTEAKFREEFGDEFMDSFFAAQRVKESRQGQAYLEGSDGLKRVYNKYEYARDKYGKEYTRNKEVRRKVDRDFKRFDDEITSEINTFKDKVNESLAARGIGSDKLRVEVVTAPSDADPAYYENGVITFDATQLSSAMGAQFLLSHELLHAVDDRFMTNEQFDALGKSIENSMRALNFDADNTFRALMTIYEPKYRNDCIKEAGKKGLRGDEALAYAEKLLERRVKEETYARFMSIAFGSESILQSLAMVNPALLEKMRDSVENSSLSNLPNSMWGYTRWQVLDRINKALSAPVDPDDLKDDLEIDKEMAFARLNSVDAAVDAAWEEYSKAEKDLEAELRYIAENEAEPKVEHPLFGDIGRLSQRHLKMLEMSEIDENNGKTWDNYDDSVKEFLSDVMYAERKFAEEYGDGWRDSSIADKLYEYFPDKYPEYSDNTRQNKEHEILGNLGRLSNYHTSLLEKSEIDEHNGKTWDNYDDSVKEFLSDVHNAQHKYYTSDPNGNEYLSDILYDYNPDKYREYGRGKNIDLDDVPDILADLVEIGSKDPLDEKSYPNPWQKDSARILRRLVQKGKLSTDLIENFRSASEKLDNALERQKEVEGRMAFARLSDNYHIDPRDNMYSKVERALNTMSLNDFKSVFNSDQALVNALTKYGVKKEEIEYSRIIEFAKELREEVNAKNKDGRMTIEEAKQVLADLTSGVFTDRYTGFLEEEVLGPGGYSSTKWGAYQYNPEYAHGYREYLYKMPDNSFTIPVHWGDTEGVVVHLRANLREATDGEPVFFVEEAQSDLHSAAQRKHNGIRRTRYESESETEVNESNRSVIQKLRDERNRLITDLTAKLNAVSEGAIKKVLDKNPEMFIAYDGGYDNEGGEYLDYINAFTGEVFDSYDEAARDITQYVESHLNKDEMIDAIVKLAAKEGIGKSDVKRSENAAQAIYYLLGDDVAYQFFDRLTELSADIKSSEKALPKRELKAIPDAPYKKDRAQLYAMQRALRHAIEENAKYLAWTTAKMQSDRYYGYVSEEAYASEYERYLPKVFGKYAEGLGGKLVKIQIPEGTVYSQQDYHPLIGPIGRFSEDQIDLINYFESGFVDSEGGIENLSQEDAQFYDDYLAAMRVMTARENDLERMEAMAGGANGEEPVLSDIFYELFPERYPELKPDSNSEDPTKVRTAEVYAIEITPELKKNIEENGQPRFAFARLSDNGKYMDPITGEEVDRNYFISPIDKMYSKLESVLRGMSLNDFKSVFNSNEALINALVNKGVKKEEIEFSDFERYADEYREIVKNKKLSVEEAKEGLAEAASLTNPILSEKLEATTPYGSAFGESPYSNFQFDPYNAKDYKAYTYSMLYNDYRSQHWRGKGIVSHLRSNVRETTDGKGVYFVEEVQSDLHSDAQRKAGGYRTAKYRSEINDDIDYDSLTREIWNRASEVAKNNPDRFRGHVTVPKEAVWFKQPDGWYMNFETGEIIEPEKFDSISDEVPVTILNLLDSLNPDNSYALDQAVAVNTLKELGLIPEDEAKNILDARSNYFNDNGDRLKIVDDAPYRKDRAVLYTMQRALEHAVDQGLDYIAWTPAWIQNDRWSDGFNYEQIYDKRIPKEFGKYAEKLGGKLTTIELPKMHESGWTLPEGLEYIGDLSEEDLRVLGTLPNWGDYHTYDGRVVFQNPITREFVSDEVRRETTRAAVREAKERKNAKHYGKPIEVQAIEITPELRENILKNGQPRFAFARLSDQHNPDVVDHMYARSAEALSIMSDKSFRSAISNPDLFLRKYLRKYGVTDEEIKQTGLVPEAQALWERVQKGELTDAEARQHLIKRAETEGILEEIVKPNTRREKSVWTDKTLMGDSDKYADYLYQLPTNHPGANFASGHWDEPGVLVHVRADKRYTTNGESVFFVEENQSDYHNQAHAKDSKTGQRIGSYNDDAPALLEEIQDKLDNADNLSDEEYKALREEERRLVSSVPHSYYENDFAEEYAMKRMLLHAIENGDDFLAWTTPQMQINRWSKKYEKAYRNTYGLRIPGFMDRYARQWGSKVEPLSLSVTYKGVPAESYGMMAGIMPADIMPEDPDVSKNGTYEVYGIRITPEMRKDVLENGQNRWSFTRIGGQDIELDEQRAQEYKELAEKYGLNENGMLSRISQHVGVSQAADRFAGSRKIRSKALNERLINAVLEGEEGLTHIIMTDDAAKLDAAKRIRSHRTIADAYNEAKNVFNGKRLVDKNDIAFGEQLIVDMARQLRNMESGQDIRENESKDPTQLLDQMQDVIAKLCAAGTRAGQNLQAFRLLKKLTPTGRLYYIEAQIDAYLSEMVDRKGLSRVGGYRYAKDSKGHIIIDEKTNKPVVIKISDGLRQKMEACKTQEEMDTVEREIIDEIAAQIPPTLTDRIVAWRYLAMLGNPRTHIRNMVSNYAMGVAVKAKDKVGGVLEDIFLKDRDVVGRTKTSKAIDPELKKALEEYAYKDWERENVSDFAMSGGKVGFQSKIDERRNKLGFGQFTFLDDVSKKNSDLLEKEDDWAARRAYKNAFVSYCAANNLTPAMLDAGTVQSNTRLAQARSYAVNEAAKATYHDANALATHLNQIEKMNGASKIIVGGLVPYKKTPANILKRGLEYSPISIVNGIKQFKNAKGLDIDSFINDRMGEFNAAAGRDKLTKNSPNYTSGAEAAKDISKVNGISKADLRYSAEATKTKMMADALDKLASGLTGTMIMMLGMLLGHLGLMKGAGDENDREEYYNQMLGQQEYSINAFGKNFTMDWLTPVSMPLFTGVELMKMIDEDGRLTFNEALDAVERLADPVMNLSVLQGINQSMSQYDSGLGKMVLSAGESYIGQFIPTLAGQVARSIDPTRRTTYAAKEGEGLGGDLEKFRNRLENKIPFVASTNSAYVDMWGRKDVDTDPFLFRLIKNSVLPMYIKEQNKTEADDYITAIFSQTGDRSVIPNSPESSYTFDGTKVYLMSDEYQATKEMVGQLSNVGVTSLMSVPGIEDLSAEEQANLVGKVYSFARAMAKAEYADAKGIADYDQDGTNTRLYNAVNAGMTIGEAVYVNYVANQFTADKNEKGNAISGSKKAKILDFYHSLGLTEDQIKAIIPSSYKYP